MRKIVFVAWGVVMQGMGRTLAAAVFCASVLPAHAVPGTLDTTFAGTGIVYTKFGFGNDVAKAAVMQPDGKLIVAGVTQDPGTVGSAIGVVRQLADGTPDATFGQGGRALITFPNLTVNSVAGVGVLADGRIVVGGIGGRTVQSSAYSFFTVRLLASGTPDPSYGFDGGFSLAATSTGIDTLNAVAFTLAPDGSALVAAHTSAGYVTVHFLANGVRDTAFGTNGTTVPVTSVTPFADTMAMAALGDGRFVIAFNDTTPTNMTYGRIRVIRYLADGSRDTGYGVGGEATFDHAYPQQAFKLALAATGEVYIASAYFGYRNGTYATDVQVVRFSAAGVVDTGWGQGLGNNDLAARITSSSFTNAVLLGLALSPVRVALTTHDNLSNSFAIQALDSAGRPDAAIGSGSGLLSSPLPAGGCPLGPSIPLVDGRWISYGPAVYTNPSRDFSLCRFLASSAFDPAWSPTGRIDIDVGNNSLVASANAVLALDDGSAITAGSAGIDDYNYGVAIAKHRADGSLDPAFGNGAGRFIDLLDGTGGIATAIAAAPAGKFVVAGRVGQTYGSANNMAVIRYLADGSLDNTFASGGRMIADLFGAADEATSAAVYADGRILVAGHLTIGGSIGSGYLVRLLANGSLDATFGSNGVLFAPFGETIGTYLRIRVLDDGRIVVAGYAGNGPYTTLGAVGRLTANGALDTSFGAGTGKWSDPGVSVINDFAVDGSGRLVIVGAESSFGQAGVRRLLANGTLDPSFGSAGVVAFQGSGNGALMFGFARCVALQGDGRIVIGGLTSDYRVAATRLLSTGAIDLSFAPATPSSGTSNGLFAYPASSSGYYFSDGAAAIALSGGSKILLAGSSRAQNVLLRLLGDSSADTDGDQIPDEIESVVGRNPLAKDNDIFSPGASSARLFAMQMYRDFLGREGDAAGVDGWTSAVASGTYTRAQVIDSFLSSQEFAGFVAPVVRLYFATFLRVPDYAGLTFNAGLVRAGTVTITQLADFFTQSPEFQATYGALNDTQFVTLLYNNVLGRAPDTAGLNGWVALLQGAYTRGQVLMGFSESVEYQAAIANDVFVSMMYTGMLRRTPEPAGLNGWVSLLETGTPRATVINGFFLSTEYRARFLP
jgi:uncharacterized delta-60 repeat protein